MAEKKAQLGSSKNMKIGVCKTFVLVNFQVCLSLYTHIYIQLPTQTFVLDGFCQMCHHHRTQVRRKETIKWQCTVCLELVPNLTPYLSNTIQLNLILPAKEESSKGKGEKKKPKVAVNSKTE